ncbi:MAG: chloride channel protein [bacterium]|nr:chloride channel protein [bacterium]
MWKYIAYPNLNWFRDLAENLRIKMVRILDAQDFNGTSFLLFLAVLIGLGGSLGAAGFRWLIETFTDLFLNQMLGALGHPYFLPLVTAAGSFLVGFIVLRWAPEARGHGVPEVMAAVATQEGRIRPRLVIVKALASALCIGSGGSVGREGPIVQIGSALGSSFGQMFRVSRTHMKILVGCGAAAGISATFNAPLAGALFALEVILGDFTVSTFSPIILSSVLANAFTHSLVGIETAFEVPDYHLVSLYELFLYAVLAVLAAAGAVGFTRLLYFLEDAFEAFSISEYAKSIIGGVLIGVLGIFVPQILGVGYGAITDVLLNRTDLVLILILLVAKYLATSITLGSGGSGGVFAPSLFLGAMLGGAYGHFVHALFPDMTGEPGAYALVGMGAVVAGTTHAPLTAMLILFEMTDNYQIILPLMLATVISTLVAKRIERESIYTLKLSRRGLRINQGVDVSILDSIPVREIMDTHYDFLKAQTPLGEIVGLLRNSDVTDFPVVDDEGNLKGLVSFQDIREVMTESDLYSLLVAADAIGGSTPAVEEDASLIEALATFSQHDIQNLPVVVNGGDRKLVGMITQSNLMRYYHQKLQEKINM